ncbi:hypothetical protein KDN32_15375 [Nocardioides sp. J2M5]|uniref:hypothetical protein n=1 Tax=Nocardioides palaemonis TaxID=2829810 RepID=UPI001BA9FE6E|nr:hypothetical protein [Nocardioides palaemonis]MBS2939120.1 hypothetical protein [Nocardioides palaemonis]
MFGGRRRRREEELAAKDRWRVARRIMDEDVTVLGEQLAELHLDTLADDLDPATRDHYRRALEHYDQAKAGLAASTTVEDVTAVEQLTTDARYHRAAVLALLAGDPLPERREPCFFDPRHGPSMQDLAWTPPGGTERSIAVCAADARRLAGDEQPEVRMVRVGDRWVPWHESGGVAEVSHRALTAVGRGQHGDGARRVVDQAAVEITARSTGGGSFGT